LERISCQCTSWASYRARHSVPSHKDPTCLRWSSGLHCGEDLLWEMRIR
jgi:hypothetical protein